MTKETPVLIVGAGPSGLLMAAALHYHGIDYCLIDQRQTQTQTSNAMAIHARTLEILDDLGVINAFMKEGQVIRSILIQENAYQPAEIKTHPIPSRYNFILSLPQKITESLLHYHLNKIAKPAAYGFTLNAIQPSKDGIIAEVLNTNRKKQIIRCQYLIACDGAHSKLRHLLKLKLTRLSITQPFVLADVRLNQEHRHTAAIYLHRDGPLMIFPMKKGQSRMVTTVTETMWNSQKSIPFLEMQAIVKKRSNNLLKIQNVSWSSSFQIQNQLLKTFYKNKVFFVGDAAHTHSPVGGQGMNTGMQDAYNLAWKLALTLRNQANARLLKSYHDERHTNAAILLKKTKQITKILLIRHPFLQWLRQKALSHVIHKKYFQKKITMALSMLNISYPKSTIIYHKSYLFFQRPAPGQRAPDLTFATNKGPRRVYDLLRTPKHVLLILTGKNCSHSTWCQVQKLKTWATQKTEHVKYYIILDSEPMNAFIPSGEYLVDTDHRLHRAYHAKKLCFFMIRPDHHIGCCSSVMHEDTLYRYWQLIFR